MNIELTQEEVRTILRALDMYIDDMRVASTECAIACIQKDLDDKLDAAENMYDKLVAHG